MPLAKFLEFLSKVDDESDRSGDYNPDSDEYASSEVSFDPKNIQ